MTLIAQIFLYLAVVCLFLHIATLSIVLLRSKWQPKGNYGDGKTEMVTILRPVSGLENNLEETLSSAFLLNHPKYEIIFCVSKDDDPVIPLVKKLMAKYHHIDSSLLIGEDDISSNPKLNNIVKGWKAAKYPWIVMTDSNVLMPKDYIAQIFARWTKNTGLVASPPLGLAPENFSANLEAAFLNSYQARWQLTSDTIGNGFAQGKTLFWSRALLEKAGGIKALAAELAEDAAATKIIRQQGLKVKLTAMPFGQPLGQKNFKTVWHRQLRWAKLRRDSFPFFFFIEILSGAFFPLLCLLLASAFSLISLSFVLIFFIIWYACEFLVTKFVHWPCSLQQMFAQISRDILLPILWFMAFGKSGYQWQGHKVEIEKNKN